MLTDLVQTIETLQQRIVAHAAELRRNEIRTRAVLIDPMLAALGWPVTDPSVVVVEYEAGGGRADYALLRRADDRPALVIEAKKYDEPLDAHRMQLLTYALGQGIPYGCLTDGNRWQVYDIFAAVRGGEPQPLDQRCRLDVTVAGDPPVRSALAFLGIWRPNLQTDGRFVDASDPFLASDLTHSPLEPADLRAAPVSPTLPSPSSPRAAGWTSLMDNFEVTNRPPPSEVRFPGRSAVAVRSWRGMFVEIALWLHEQGLLTRQNCQIPRGQGNRVIFSTNGMHPNGEPFRDLVQIESAGLVLEGNMSGKACVRLAKDLLARFGHDPSQVYLRLPG